MQVNGETGIYGVLLTWAGWLSLGNIRSFTNASRIKDLKETMGTMKEDNQKQHQATETKLDRILEIVLSSHTRKAPADEA